MALAGTCMAQAGKTGSVQGRVTDSLTTAPLEGASVVALYAKDSSMAGYGTTDSTGLFHVKDLLQGAYILGISYTGFAEAVFNFQVRPDSLHWQLPAIALRPDTNTLEDVIISRPPVTIKGDTVEFRAGSFATPPNATVEDLLKKLPGMEVDQEGNVTAQGEDIRRIYVDGKEFFSNDPKLALLNLTAEMVESIQVFDDMSDQAKFTRIDDGSRTRTINIKLKKDRRKGVFGRAQAGGGTSDRYTGNGSINMFNEDRQLSLLGGANNINRLGFTQNDLDRSLNSNNNNNRNNRNADNNTRTPASGANGDGNTASWSAGFNFRDNWGAKTTVGASYFVSETNRQLESQRLRQNFFPNDSTSFTNTQSQNQSRSVNHNINLRLEHTLDSMNSILITPQLTWGNTYSRVLDTVSTRGVGKMGEFLAIAGSNNRTNQRNNLSLGNNLLFRHRFARPGRTFTVGWSTNVGRNDADGVNELPYIFYRADGSIRRVQDVRQRNETLGRNFNNTISTSYTEMVAEGKILELNYAFTNNQSISDRVSNDFNIATGAFDSLNKPLTNYFENSFISSRVGTNFRVKNKKYDYQMGGAVQFAKLENMSRRAISDKDSTMYQKFVNFFPNASFNYNLGTRKSLRLQYRGSTRAPSITQLQDVLDISNPQRLRIGNPDLKQEFTNNFTLTHNTFNAKTFMFLNTSIQANIISNRIVNSLDTVSTTVQIIKPENVNGAQNFSLNATLGIPLKKVQRGRRSPMNLNLTTNLRTNREVSLIFKEVNYNYNHSIGQRVAFNYNIDRKLDLNVFAHLTYFESRYSVQEQLNAEFYNHRYGLNATAYLAKRLKLHTDADVIINAGRADGFNQTIPIWNASAGWMLFKRSNGEITFNVTDILNLNKSISRNTGDNFIDDSFVNVLRRFYMVTFMVNLTRFGGPPPRNAPGRGTAPLQRPAGGQRPAARPAGGTRGS